MCGIMGYCGIDEAALRVLDGLRELEYRGYDSAGVAVMAGDGRIEVRKDVGQIEEVATRHRLPEMGGGVALGHTRWATHGGVTQQNAHPHTDGSGGVAVVHNGIVENFQDLRMKLAGEGVVFTSETDTEVIPHLIARTLHEGASTLEQA
ncbi:MAG: glutamine--fructose-6-phosphate aminotransferase, partial [Armatimonadia bacterium]|nr:glutamine--fructose-6-phosphate aminotransferase [Armatimonadia bacterium]